MMPERPSIYLTTAGAVTAVRTGKARPETRAAVGPGPVLSIMRHPRPSYGEAGEGRVLSLTPTQALIEAVRDAMQTAAGPAEELAAWETYEAALLRLWRPALLTPEKLTYAKTARQGEPNAARWDGEWWRPVALVPDGATLICACGVEKARAGRCHRVIAARLLAEYSGRRVFLDGVEVAGG